MRNVLRVEALLRDLPSVDKELVRKAMRYSRIAASMMRKRTFGVQYEHVHFLICRDCRRLFVYARGARSLERKVCRSKYCGGDNVLLTRQLRWGLPLRRHLIIPEVRAKNGALGGTQRAKRLRRTARGRARLREIAAKGGAARALSLTAEQRRKSASEAARARWGNLSS
jgi:LSD1 subclass zinc finger protein